MNDIEKAVGRLVHDLEYDAEYADISGYAKDLRLLMRENKRLREELEVSAPKVLKEKNGKVTKIEFKGIHFTRIDGYSYSAQGKRG